MFVIKKENIKTKIKTVLSPPEKKKKAGAIVLAPMCVSGSRSLLGNNFGNTKGL